MWVDSNIFMQIYSLKNPHIISYNKKTWRENSIYKDDIQENHPPKKILNVQAPETNLSSYIE